MMRTVALALLCLGVLGGSILLAQPYRCDWSVIGIAGGGMRAADYRAGATAGQTAAGLMAGTGYRAFIGFWQAEPATGILEKEGPTLPEGPVTRLETIAPNPLPGRAQLRYSLAAEGLVNITIHDITGRQVRTLVSGSRPAGNYTAVWPGDDNAGRELAKGIYFCRFAAGEVRQTSKLILAR